MSFTFVIPINLCAWPAIQTHHLLFLVPCTILAMACNLFQPRTITTEHHRQYNRKISFAFFSERKRITALNYPSLVVNQDGTHQMLQPAFTENNKTMTWPLTPPIIHETEDAPYSLPSANGKFGKFGGKFVPETLITCLNKLEDELELVLHDGEFQVELRTALRDFVGRETPLYFATRLTNHYKNKVGEGPKIYLKREDLAHGGAHKMNNAIAQAMLAKRLGLQTVVAATGAGNHGVATAAACAKLDLDCTIIMSSTDIEKQPSNVTLMSLLGAQVLSTKHSVGRPLYFPISLGNNHLRLQIKAVDGRFKDAASEAIREWVNNLETTYYLSGNAVGPHPCPRMIREFQSVIGKETRRQSMEKWGDTPDVLVACVGSGSNAIGLFHEFVNDKKVRLIGVEGGGVGFEFGEHSATLAQGEVGAYHGAISYLLQDDDGNTITPHSIALGLEYPGVSPELSFLKDNGRAEFYTATDQEAIEAYKRLCRLEGIFPALEASHALAFLDRLCPTLPNGSKVVVCCSGRGNKDAAVVFQSNNHKLDANLSTL